MSPTFDTGDILLVRPDGDSIIRQSDVITYRARNGTTVTHRVDAVIERKDGTFYRVKGDANATADPDLVPRRAVGALVWGRLPLGNLLIHFFESQLVRVLLLTMPFAILIVGDNLTSLKSVGVVLRFQQRV